MNNNYNQIDANNNLYQNMNQPKKSNKNLYILLIIVVCISALLIFVAIMLTNGEKSSNVKEKNTNTNTNTNKENTGIKYTNSNFANAKPGLIIGKVDPGTNLTYDENGAFLMYVEDIFEIQGQGVKVSGRIERGTIHLGDQIQVLGLDGKVIDTMVVGIEMFRKQLDSATIEDSVAIQLRGVKKENISRGAALIKPNSMVAATNFQAEIQMGNLKSDKKSIATNDKASFAFTVGHEGIIELPIGVEKANPGDSLFINVQLDAPVAIEVGKNFNMIIDGHLVANGKVTKIN